jgi:UDP-glucuronate decarboxylase
MTGSKSKIEFSDLPSDDPKQRKPDVTQAEKLINWEPKINLREGLQRTIKYFEGLV